MSRMTSAAGPPALAKLPRPVVHLELHTHDRVRASDFYAELLAWRPELVRTAAGSYLR